MILTCPECQTRYQVDTAVLGARGRKVRCAKCGHTWVQEPEARAARARDPDVLRTLDEARQGATARRDPERRQPGRGERGKGRRKGGANVPALRKRRRRWRARVAWLLLVIALGALATSSATMRQNIITVWPAAAKLYDMVGMAPPGFGLKLPNPSVRQTVERGSRVLLVRGRISNDSHRARQVPRLRGALLDKADRELQHWTFAAPKRELRPGQTITYTTRIRNPVSSASRLTIVFDEEPRK